MIFDVYARTLIKDDWIMPKPIQLCQSFDNLCGTLLTKVNCPKANMTNVACLDFDDYDTFEGICTCGSFDVGSVRVAELLVDGQVKFNATSSFVSVWPTES